jgi:DNA-binding transcriptional MerR regulator
LDKSPDAFRTISEVADDLDLPQHVLRFWETRFTQIKPMKRGGGRRYYRPEDVELLKGIRHLLYDHGYTIKGVQKLLKTNGNKFVSAIASGDVAAMDAIIASSNDRHVDPKVGGAAEDDQVLGRPKVRPSGCIDRQIQRRQGGSRAPAGGPVRPPGMQAPAGPGALSGPPRHRRNT